jgi:hypothetical protein
MAGMSNEKGYERYGWLILSANAILGIFAAVLTSSPSLFLFPSPHFGNAYPILLALGTALVGFNILTLVIILIPYSGLILPYRRFFSGVEERAGK